MDVENYPGHKTIAINFPFAIEPLAENNDYPGSVRNQIAVPLAARVSDKLQSKIWSNKIRLLLDSLTEVVFERE